MRDLKGRVALVTGASSGIGKATALALASEGAHLVICGRNEVALNEVAALVAARSVCLLARRVDVTKGQEVQALADEVHGLVPALDILVNGAGVAQVGAFLATPPEDWQWVMGTNVEGVVSVCRAFVPAMVARGHGAVVNIASMGSYVGTPLTTAYSASKFAVLGFSEALGAELSPHGIRVSAVCPGMVNTNVINNARVAGVGDESRFRNRVGAKYRARNFDPAVVARAVLKVIRTGAPLLPVTPEAWLLYYLKRLCPRVLPYLTRLMTQQLTK